jgi:hypothetical protein
MVNPPTKYKQIIISQLPHGEISRYKAKKGCFSSTKANFRIFFRIVKDNLKYRAFYVKYYKNMTFFSEGWQPCFHYTGTWQVPGMNGTAKSRLLLLMNN